MLTAFSQQVNPGLPTVKWWIFGGEIGFLVHHTLPISGRKNVLFLRQARLYLTENPDTIPAMKMKPITVLIVVGTLLAFTVSAQKGPVRILPAPVPQLGIAVEVESAPPPPNFFPGQAFPEEPMESEEGWGEPGEMMMPPTPGRYKILSVQLPQAGKLTSVVLKLDTQTGETWQLKLTESFFLLNGKQQIRTRLSFEPVVQARDPRHGRAHGFVPGGDGHGVVDDDVAVERIAPGRPDVVEINEVEAVPVRPQPRRIRAPRR